MSLTSNTLILSILGKINPAIYDVIFPQGPEFSIEGRDLMVSMVLKSIPQHIIGPNNAHELKRVGKSLFETSVKSMDYDDNNWCGTGRRPHRHADPIADPMLRFELNPQPEPPGDKLYYAAIVTQLAEAVSNRELATELRTIGMTIKDGAQITDTAQTHLSDHRTDSGNS